MLFRVFLELYKPFCRQPSYLKGPPREVSTHPVRLDSYVSPQTLCVALTTYLLGGYFQYIPNQAERYWVKTLILEWHRSGFQSRVHYIAIMYLPLTSYPSDPQILQILHLQSDENVYLSVSLLK